MYDKAAGRRLLRSDGWEAWSRSEYDQNKGVPFPPMEKPFPPGAALVDLVAPAGFPAVPMTLLDAIRSRASHRKYTEAPLSLAELSFLLWATQGVRELVNDGKVSRRMVPSGGARHPFETYLSIQRVGTLAPGLYRYLPLSHRMCVERTGAGVHEEINAATRGQNRGCAVVFVWTAIPYRTEWRYDFLSPKLIAIDAGHLCQNLYLACTAIGAGTCGLDAYDQDLMDAALGVDGSEELSVYCAAVGKVLP